MPCIACSVVLKSWKVSGMQKESRSKPQKSKKKSKSCKKVRNKYRKLQNSRSNRLTFDFSTLVCRRTTGTQAGLARTLPPRAGIMGISGSSLPLSASLQEGSWGGCQEKMGCRIGRGFLKTPLNLYGGFRASGVRPRPLERQPRHYLAIVAARNSSGPNPEP